MPRSVSIRRGLRRRTRTPKPVQCTLLGLFGLADAADQPDNAMHAVVVNPDCKTEHAAPIVTSGNLRLFDATTRTWSPSNLNRVTPQQPSGGGNLVRRVSPKNGSFPPSHRDNLVKPVKMRGVIAWCIVRATSIAQQRYKLLAVDAFVTSSEGRRNAFGPLLGKFFSSSRFFFQVATQCRTTLIRLCFNTHLAACRGVSRALLLPEIYIQLAILCAAIAAIQSQSSQY